MTAVPAQRIGPFPLGMDNRAPDYELRLPDGSGNLLRDALNVDVTGGGSIKTRPGFSLSVAGTDCHSLWSDPSIDFALYADAGVLKRLNSDGTTSVVRANIGLATRVRFAVVYEAIFYTDGIVVGSYHPLSGPTPAWLDAQAATVGDQTLVPMPAGQQIAHHGGRLLVAVGSALIYSEPFQPTLRDEAKGFELFPAPITCLAAVEAGVFVVADKTYFIAGGLPAENVQAVLEYGAPDQQAVRRDDGGAQWLGTQGVVSVTRAGEISNLQDAHIAQIATGSAATLYREADGMKTIIAALSRESDMGAGIGSFAQARVVRKAY